MFVPDSAWIERFAVAVYATMRRCQCDVNACVEAARIAVGVARSFGYICEPVPVAVQVVAGREVTVVMGPGHWERRGRGGYGGHLVVSFPGADELVDLTSDQFDAPARGLRVPAPLVIPASREQLAAGFGIELPGGTRMKYRELVGDVAWRSLPAWTEPSTLSTALAVKELRAASRPHRV